jgi:glycosyltransferase involved in cell wall biosynthesis
MNAVDEARFAGRAGGTADQGQALPPKSATFVMMYHGTLTRIYGLDLAVEAFGRAHEQMPGAEIWILGSGPEQGPLAELAERCGVGSKVKLIGQIPSGEIPKWLEQCDLGLLPIRRDVFLDFAFPNKLPEFIVAGKAVLVSRLRAIHRYFSDDAVVFFEPNDVDDLARQMVYAYGDPELRRRLVQRAREEYSPIDWTVMKQRYVDLVGRLAEGRVVRRQHAEPTSVAR